MEINGKVHCFFDQSGTFKNEFIKPGIPAEDYDIQNKFGETDHIVAVAFSVAAICTFVAWVACLAICLMRWLNG